MFRIREFNRLSDLDVLRDDWCRLYHATPDRTWFQSFDWFECYWKFFGEKQRMRVLAVDDLQGQCLGIVPLVIRAERRRVGRVRTLTYPLDDWASCYGPIAADPEPVLAAALGHVRETRAEWDVLDLRWIIEDTPNEENTLAALQSADFPAYRQVRDHSAVIDVPESPGEFQNRWSSKARNNYRRNHRRLEEDGVLEYEHFRPGSEQSPELDPRFDLFEVCVEIASKSWQGSSTTGTTLSHPEVQSFLREAHASAARCGAVDIHLLFLSGRPLAFGYNYHAEGRVLGLRIGFDPEVSRHGAGSCLYVRAVDRAAELGDRIYDLGPGSLEAKRHMSPRLVAVLQYTHYRTLAPRAQLLRLKHHGPWRSRPSDQPQDSAVS